MNTDQPKKRFAFRPIRAIREIRGSLLSSGGTGLMTDPLCRKSSRKGAMLHKMKFKTLLAFALTVSAAVLFRAAAAAADSDSKTLYENNFEKSAVGSVPDEFLVLDGAFKVQQEGGNKLLELPGTPLDAFGLLFGPTEKNGIAVSARIFGTNQGRRFPAFGVGLNGVGGYKLQVSPAKKLIELYRGETLKKSVAHGWTPGQWTHLRLQIQKAKDGGWIVAGKIWAESEKEPTAPTISIDEKEEPSAGRASIWGMPYSGTPIRFDDLAVKQLSEKP